MKKKGIILKSFVFLSIALSSTSCSFFNSLFNWDNAEEHPDFKFIGNISTDLNISRAKLSGTPVTMDNPMPSSNVYRDVDYPAKYATHYDINYNVGYRYTESTGNINILVVPISLPIIDYQYRNEISVKNDPNYPNGDFTTPLQKAFFGTNNSEYPSVAQYYKTDSYGKLNFDGRVTSTLKIEDSIEIAYAKYQNGTFFPEIISKIYNNILKKSFIYDGLNFDQNNDGKIDALWLVYDIPHYANLSNYNYSPSKAYQDLFWAFTGWTRNSDYAEQYAWASYQFMNSTDSKAPLTYYYDPHTFIHETGHMLGLNDYYSYDSSATAYYSPVGSIDMMDNNIGTHNAFSKFLLGWVDPKVIVNEGTITLRDFNTYGDSVIIPLGKEFNDNAMDRYIILQYARPTTGNNLYDSKSYSGIKGLTKEGVRAYYVDARIGQLGQYKRTDTGETYTLYTEMVKANGIDAKQIQNRSKVYAVVHSNTPSQAYDYFSSVKTNEPLIESISSRYNVGDAPYSRGSALTQLNYYTDQDLFYKGTSLRNILYKNREDLMYGVAPQFNFTVDSTGDVATVTFTKW